MDIDSGFSVGHSQDLQVFELFAGCSRLTAACSWMPSYFLANDPNNNDLIRTESSQEEKA